MSSKALMTDVIWTLFKFNGKISEDPVISTSWRGRRICLLVHAVIMLAFVCLLHIDEVLNLYAEDVEILSLTSILITLNSHKMQQLRGKYSWCMI